MAKVKVLQAKSAEEMETKINELSETHYVKAFQSDLGTGRVLYSALMEEWQQLATPSGNVEENLDLGPGPLPPGVEADAPEGEEGEPGKVTVDLGDQIASSEEKSE